MEEQQHPVPCEHLIRVQEKQAMFEWWQKEQNGTLKEIKATLLALDAKMDARLEALVAKMDSRLDAQDAANLARFDATSAKIDARAEAARAPGAELGTWIRNTLWALLLFVAGIAAKALTN